MQLMKLAATTTAFGVLSMLALACKSEEPAQTSGYPQQTQPVATAPAGYGQPVATTPAATTPAPVATTPVAAAPAATLSPPGPLALPCTSDAQCATAKCNTQFGKCVFPCQNDNDCIAPNRCMAGACLPAMQ
jgi:hypothetical protein